MAGIQPVGEAMKAAVLAMLIMTARPCPAPAPEWADAQPGWTRELLRGLQ